MNLSRAVFMAGWLLLLGLLGLAQASFTVAPPDLGRGAALYVLAAVLFVGLLESGRLSGPIHRAALSVGPAEPGRLRAPIDGAALERRPRVSPLARLPALEDPLATLAAALAARVSVSLLPLAGVSRALATTRPRWLTISRVGVIAEWAVIVVLVWTYCAPFMGSLGTADALPGDEAEFFQSLDWTLVNSLRGDGQFPLWNPYLRGGTPYVGDPYLHVWNPLVTVPILLYGVSDGFKIALFLAYLAAGLGAWYLGAALRLGPLSRLWLGCMYAFTGQAVAKWFQGHYDFVLGFAWIPWAVATLIVATRTGRRRHIVAAAFALALLFLSGNAYYSYYTLFVVAIYGLVTVVRARRARPYVALDGRALRTFALVGGLALGLIALQLLPLVASYPYLMKQGDPDMATSHSLDQVWGDYVSPDVWRPDAQRYLPLPPNEYYAYVGIWPFLAVALLPLIVRRGQRRMVLFLGLVFAFAILLATVRDNPLGRIYATYQFLNQFRYPNRVLIVGALAIAALAALSLDAALRWAWRLLAAPDGPPRRARLVVAIAAGAALLTFMAWSVRDVYAQNGKILGVRPPYLPPFEYAETLRALDSSPYWVDHMQNWHTAFISNRVRYIWGACGPGYFCTARRSEVPRQLILEPKYDFYSDGGPTPPADAEPVGHLGTTTIYRLPHSLPYAFAVDRGALDRAAPRPLQADEVRPLAAAVPGPNTIGVSVEGDERSTLVVMSSWFPGWEARVDGRPAPLRNVGGFLAADLEPGQHQYEFAYSPPAFWLGLAITLLALATALALVVRDRAAPLRREGVPPEA
jgi:Bacterial membrane protein YfhO